MRQRLPLAASLLSAVGAFSLLLSACGSSINFADSSSSQPQTIEVHARWASANANDLATLLATSDEVFLGQVTRLIAEQQLPTTSGEASPLAPQRSFPLSQFRVVVERPLAGNLLPGQPVTIEQLGGPADGPDGTLVRLELEGDEPLAIGGVYLFFVTRKANGAFASPPFARLSLDDAGELLPLPEWKSLGAMRLLAGLSLDEIAARVSMAGEESQ